MCAPPATAAIAARIAECAAERHRPEQRCIRRIQPDVAGNVGSVPGDRLLIMQDELRPAGGARGGERQAGHLPGRLVRPSVGRYTVERRHRQAGKFGHADRKRQCKDAAQSGAIFRGQGGENRREVDRRELPFRHQSDSAGTTQKVADFRGAKARVDVDRKRA